MILVAGSANVDFVVRAPHIPAPGETVLGSGFETFSGGKGANQAVACARAGGADTALLVALGEDPFATTLESALTAAGVRMHIVRASGKATGAAFICVADDAENAITVAPGANGALLESHLPPLDGVTHLLMQLETPIDTVSAYARAARACGVKVVLNAAPAHVLAPGLLALIDVLIVNQGELATVSGRAGDLAQSLACLDVPCVIVTLGERGSCARIDGQTILQESFAVVAVDTTAAGDTFCGVLVAALGCGLGLREALRRASAAAALACTRLGAQSSIPTHAEVQAFLKQRAATAQ